MSAVVTFAAVAAQFCEWVERSPSSAEEDFASARLLASRLYAYALELPSSAADVATGAAPSRAEDSNARRPDVFVRFAALPINMYAVVDPLVVPGEGVGVGDVADDLTDAYFDVLLGLRLYRVGATAEAARHWSVSFRHHWGAHVVQALAALHGAAAPG